MSETGIVIRLQTIRSFSSCHAQRKWERQNLREGVGMDVGTLMVMMIHRFWN